MAAAAEARTTKVMMPSSSQRSPLFFGATASVPGFAVGGSGIWTFNKFVITGIPGFSGVEVCLPSRSTS